LIVNVVKNYIERLNLLDKHDKCIVALSGGADSVALLLILKELGFRVEVAHCNFHLRGKESDRDEKFVKGLCQQLDTELHLVHFDTYEYSTLHKVSIEMAARNLRYTYFEQLRRDVGADAVCVAHHREDSVETLLINLIRGTGLHGLSGIRPRNGYIVRPLLCISRNDIEEYLKEKGQTFVTDSTNLIDDVVRNKIRLDVIPLLRQINPMVDSSIQHTAELIDEVSKVFDQAIGKAIEEISKSNRETTVIDIKKLKEQASPEYTLYEILKQYGFSPQTIEQVYANINAPSGRIFSSKEYDMAIDRGRIIIEHKQEETAQVVRITEEGIYMLNNGAKLKVETKEGKEISYKTNVCTLDADKVSFPLYIRKVKRGDRFVPFGMKGTKLVSDYLTNKKRTVLEKRKQLVMEDAKGEIVWLVNERTSDNVRIDADSKRTLVLTYQSIVAQ